MEKGYVYFSVLHPGKAKQISVDIEVDSTEDMTENSTYGKNGSVLDEVIIPLMNNFTECGLSAKYISTGLHNFHRQNDYLGNADEIIHKILGESESVTS